MGYAADVRGYFGSRSMFLEYDSVSVLRIHQQGVGSTCCDNPSESAKVRPDCMSLFPVPIHITIEDIHMTHTTWNLKEL